VMGSIALVSLYVAYKFLPMYWVNLLLTSYISILGCCAVAQTIHTVAEKVSPSTLNDPLIDTSFQLPSFLANPEGPYVIKASICLILCYVVAVGMSVCWLITKSWLLHNVIAVCFCIQAIAMISVGSFTIAAILLSGLFIYDIFWVFGTDVMVTVAKNFEAPAKIIFPVSFTPFAQSILGLGDIVIPGVFVSMVLRFDFWLHEQELANKNMSHKKTDGDTKIPKKVDIHERFSKLYFWCVILAYEFGLLLTNVVMVVFKHPQPALLYLVPCCLIGLNLPALCLKQLGEVYSFTEEDIPKKIEPIVEKQDAQNEKSE